HGADGPIFRRRKGVNFNPSLTPSVVRRHLSPGAGKTPPESVIPPRPIRTDDSSTTGNLEGSVAKIVKLEHAWRRLDGRNDDGFQVAPFPGWCDPVGGALVLSLSDQLSRP